MLRRMQQIFEIRRVDIDRIGIFGNRLFEILATKVAEGGVLRLRFDDVRITVPRDAMEAPCRGDQQRRIDADRHDREIISGRLDRRPAEHRREGNRTARRMQAP